MRKAMMGMVALCAVLLLAIGCGNSGGGSNTGERPAPLTGAITAADAGARTLKVKGADGQEKAFKLKDGAMIKVLKAGAMTDGTVDDLKVGAAVRVISDGKVARILTIAATVDELNAPLMGAEGAPVPTPRIATTPPGRPQK